MKEKRNYYHLNEIDGLPLINLSLYRNTGPKDRKPQQYFERPAAELALPATSQLNLYPIQQEQ